MSANTSTSGGTSTGQKIRGAAEVVHGLGEHIRGKFNTTADTATNTGGRHGEVNQGRVETERGMSKITGKQYGGEGTAQAAMDTSNTGRGTGVMPPPGTGATMPQGQYQNQYPAGASGNQNAGMQGANTNPPMQQGGPAPDYTATGPGTGVPAGGPRELA